MKNKMHHVCDHLVAMLERLNDDGASPEVMAQNMERAKVAGFVASVYVSATRAQIEAVRAYDETNLMVNTVEVPGMARVIDAGTPARPVIGHAST